MSRNEKTSAPVAKIAATVLNIDGVTMNVFDADGWNVNGVVDLKWSDICALAASALTQTADKERRYNPDVPQPWVDQPNSEQKAALEWLDTWAMGTVGDGPNVRHARTLKAMLLKHEDKPLKVDRQPAPKRRPFDDVGFDPRDGGKVGKQRVPRRRKAAK